MNRSLIVVSVLLGFVAGRASAEPLQVGADKQLFLDDRFVARSEGVALVVNRPRPTGEKLIVADKPWEEFWIGAYTSVLQDADRIHLWYALDDKEYEQGRSKQRLNALAYAYSTDGGGTWIKPNLGVVEYAGSRDNNLVLLDGGGSSVFFNRPEAPASERFVIYSGRRNNAFYSPDGIHWTPTGKSGFLNMGGVDGLDSQNIAFWDSALRKYVAYPRINVKVPRPTPNNPNATFAMRTVGRTASDTFSGFPIPEVNFAPDKSDPPNVGFYTSAALQYPLAAEAYLMFPAVIHEHGDDPVDIQFAVSRDGAHWQRPDRSPLIRLRAEERCLYAGCGLSRHKDELSLYYTSYAMGHNQRTVDKATRAGTITRAIYRLDGFMSMDAGYTGGEFTTPPLVFAGNRLEINFDASAGGEVRVEIRDADDKPIARYTEDQTLPITGSSVAHPVRWRDRKETDVTELKGKPIRLRFLMRDAKLYAFQFPGGKSM